MNFALTSSHEIIARVMRDFRLSNINWQSSGYDWIADAMSAINQWYAFEMKSKTMTVCNHKVKFPCDLVELLGISYNGYKLPLGKNHIGVHTSRDLLTCHTIESDLFNYEKVKEMNYKVEEVTNLQNLYESDPRAEYLERIVELNKQIAKYSIPYAANFRCNGGLEYYNLQPGFIQTTFEHGEITLHYTGAVSDEDGLPLIPDVYEFKEAIAWFIVSRILMGGAKHPTFRYEDADARWREFQRKASNKVKMPSIDRMNALVNMWTRPVYDRFLPETFFNYGEKGTHIE